MNTNQTPSITKTRQGNPNKWSSTANLHSKALALNRSTNLYSIFETKVEVEGYDFFKNSKRPGIVRITVGDRKQEIEFQGDSGGKLGEPILFQDYEPPQRMDTRVLCSNAMKKLVVFGSNIHMFIKNKQAYSEQLMIMDKGEIKGKISVRISFRVPNFSPPKIFTNPTSFSKHIKKFFIHSEQVMEKGGMGYTQPRNDRLIKRSSIEKLVEDKPQESSSKRTDNKISRPSAISSRNEQKSILFKNLSVTEQELADLHQKISISQQKQQLDRRNTHERTFDSHPYNGSGRKSKDNPEEDLTELRKQIGKAFDVRRDMKAKTLNLQIFKQLEINGLKKKQKKCLKKEQAADSSRHLLKKIADLLYSEKFAELKDQRNWYSFKEATIDSETEKDDFWNENALTTSIIETKEGIKELEFEHEEMLRIKNRLVGKLQAMGINKPPRRITS